MADYLEIARQALERYRAQQEGNSEDPPFPHCPRCASYYLYRRNNQGKYQCQSCGLTEITEEIARRVV
jgi:hypothetical protein